VTHHPKVPLVVGNWKMNLGEAEARALVASLLASIPFDRVNAAVAPSFPCLRTVLDAVAGTRLAVAAQNAHDETRGAFTGEVSPALLAEMGARYVILGHSERRHLFGETDATVSKKVAAARRCGLIPILCVGEIESQRDAGRCESVVAAQIHAAFRDPSVRTFEDVVVAYEPVWAIGTGRTPQLAEVTSAHAAIRAALEERFGGGSAAVHVLYGGSVTPANAPALLTAAGVDGALVGGASLSAASFASIAAAAAA